MPREVKKILPSITHVLVAESSPALLSVSLWQKTASPQEFQTFFPNHRFLRTRYADSIKVLNMNFYHSMQILLSVSKSPEKGR